MTRFSDRIPGHYERHARAWDTERRHAVWSDKPWHDRFVSALPSGATVLDLGCGGGDPVALNMVDYGLRVTGVDMSPTLISLCRERMPQEAWIMADMRSLSFDATIDGILAWDSFFHLKPDDQRHMFDVFARHSGEGTILMFNGGPSDGEAIGSYRGEPLYHAGLGPQEYESRLHSLGFQVIHYAIEDRLAGGRTAWLTQRIAR